MHRTTSHSQAQHPHKPHQPQDPHKPQLHAEQQSEQQQSPEHVHPQQHPQQQHQQQRTQHHEQQIHPAPQQQEHVALILRYNLTKLLCDVLNADPACISLMHVYNLLKRAKNIKRPLTNAVLITAWGDINDLLYAYEGKLPFDIYDQALGVYGNDAAKLILNCDANILKNTAPHPSQRIRSVSLLETLRPLRETVELETGDEAMSLRRCLSWVSDRDARSRNGAGRGSGEEFTDQPDTDMLLMWAEGQGPGRGTIGNGGRSR
ncbi:hypothetical protein VYU27_007809 [Nannochloropsis oceanica]